MQRPRAIKALLIAAASVSSLPRFPVLDALSDPAKSTIEKWDLIEVLPIHSTSSSSDYTLLKKKQGEEKVEQLGQCPQESFRGNHRI